MNFKSTTVMIKRCFSGLNKINLLNKDQLENIGSKLPFNIYNQKNNENDA